MRRLIIMLCLAVGFGAGVARAANPAADRLAVKCFDLSAVRLLDGPFKHAQEMDRKYLLMLEPDRLLAGFRREAGLTPKGQSYGGWEANSIAGHTAGHYLSAVSQMYAATGDPEFKRRADYIVDEFAICQKAQGDGYFAAIPGGKTILIEQIARGDIRSKGFDLNGLWVPWYTIHKQFAGLLDAHHYCDNARALTVARGMADWIDHNFSGLTETQWQKMLQCEHGGMNEVLAALYARTGEDRYLKLARCFEDHSVLDPLAEGKDILPGRHANTSIPKVIGLARLYELTGNMHDRRAASFFWDRVVHHHSYIEGGNSEHEHFGEPDRLADRLGPETAETCNVYNMLKLTEHLYSWRPTGDLADYYERALYNHILTSQNPQNGMMLYFLPLTPEKSRGYNTPFDSFWCCTGSGMENHARYGSFIYAHSDEALYINLYIPSELNGSQRDVKARIDTDLPRSDKVVVHVSAQQNPPVVYLRVPYWVSAPPALLVNGKPFEAPESHDGYIAIDPTTLGRDATIELTLPMNLRVQAMPDDAHRVAVCYGPVVLAADLGPDTGTVPPMPVVLGAGQPVDQWVHPVEDQPLHWRMQAAGSDEALTLVPLNTLHDRFYSVYFDLVTPQQWAQKQAQIAAERARQRELAARTIDTFTPGQMQPERDHRFDGDKTANGTYRDRTWRDARDGGRFAFDMKVLPDAPVLLNVTYWGSDVGGREFDILIDGTKIASQTLNNNKPGEFFDVVYPIPRELTDHKTSVRVIFQAHPGRIAGGIFGCATLRAKH